MRDGSGATGGRRGIRARSYEFDDEDEVDANRTAATLVVLVSESDRKPAVSALCVASEFVAMMDRRSEMERATVGSEKRR